MGAGIHDHAIDDHAIWVILPAHETDTRSQTRKII
jgi:hypothetical protein